MNLGVHAVVVLEALEQAVVEARADLREVLLADVLEPRAPLDRADRVRASNRMPVLLRLLLENLGDSIIQATHCSLQLFSMDDIRYQHQKTDGNSRVRAPEETHGVEKNL